MKKKATISECLGWLKTMNKRHAELIALRNANASKVATDYQGKTVVQTPVYDARDLDRKISVLAREIRICDTAIKTMNGKTLVEDYTLDDDVLAELT